MRDRTLDDIKSLFATREEAVAAYEASVAREIDFYKNQTKEKFFMDLYQGWINDFKVDPRVVDAIKGKVKADFGIDVDQY